ncbi:MAG: AmmeMemoRadiSam system protein B, partial [Thermoplasmata archaeon]
GFNIMIRKAVVAGHFYEGERERLMKEIKNCFLKGTGALPEVKRGAGKIKGIVVPHAGYEYSGYVAACAYREIARDGFPRKCIILGPNHQGIGTTVAIMTDGEWETPLGTVPIADDAKKYCTGIIENDEIAHQYEHSIEVQLPFLQFLSNDFSFIPVCIGWQEWDIVREVGDILSQADDVLFIASSDFSHVDFSGFPSEREVDEQVKKKDMMAIGEILNLDAKGLVETVRRYGITMCGYGAVAAMLQALKGKATGARLLRYATSYDVAPGTYCVGYAAIVIE